MNTIFIYELFLRDGLQSLEKCYSVEEKIEMFNLLNQCGFSGIEFGSTTKASIVPQMKDSFVLWDYVKEHQQSNTKYTMLVPSIHHLDQVIKAGIDSIGIIVSIADDFAYRNMRMNSEETFTQALKIIDRYTGKHIRIYLSQIFDMSFSVNTENSDLKCMSFSVNTENSDLKCMSFSVNTENSETRARSNLETIHRYTKEFTKIAYLKQTQNVDIEIVLADTVGLCDVESMRRVLEVIEDKEFIGVHLHIRETPQLFESIVDEVLKSGIIRFDTSLFGIGGCPYAKELIGNVSTIPLVKYLHQKGYQTGINVDKLEKTIDYFKL
jgi:hydroxymethylglutaryl-CoA lyase